MTEQAKMQTIPKKNIIIMLIVLLIYALIFGILGYTIDRLGSVSSHISAGSLSTWKVGGILLSLYTLTTPWRWQKKLNSLTNRQNVTSHQIWGVLILFCFVPFIAPLVYGLMLLFLGISIIEFYYFVALSVVGALLWSFYNLRKSS
jgi:hypothetical protein